MGFSVGAMKPAVVGCPAKLMTGLGRFGSAKLNTLFTAPGFMLPAVAAENVDKENGCCCGVLVSVMFGAILDAFGL